MPLTPLGHRMYPSDIGSCWSCRACLLLAFCCPHLMSQASLYVRPSLYNLALPPAGPVSLARTCAPHTGCCRLQNTRTCLNDSIPSAQALPRQGQGIGCRLGLQAVDGQSVQIIISGGHVCLLYITPDMHSFPCALLGSLTSVPWHAVRLLLPHPKIAQNRS